MKEARHVVRARLMRARQRERDRRWQQEQDAIRSEGLVRLMMR